jgi:hypothetical protein
MAVSVFSPPKKVLSVRLSDPVWPGSILLMKQSLAVKEKGPGSSIMMG